MRIRSPIAPSLIASLVWHAAMGLCLLWLIRSGDHRPAPTRQAAAPSLSIVYLEQAGRGGGGGGGGSETPAPARQARRQGSDHLSVPVARPPDALASKPPPPEPVPTVGVDIPAMSLAAAIDSLSGSMRGQPSAPADSRGPGRGPGAGVGEGAGDGPGRGRGVGDGRDRGQGGDWYASGGGVTPPVPLYRGMPRYTAEAAQARVQGSILVECIVETNGRCARARIVRSIEPPFGLDREAIAAANEWRFRPGMRGAEQVPVLVTIEVAFTIR